MYTRLLIALCVVGLGMFGTSTLYAEAEAQGGAWLLTKEDIRYTGAFKLPGGKGGAGEHDHFGFSGNRIAYDADRDSFFVAGHNYIGGAAEVTNPGQLNALTLSDLPRAEYVQDFRYLLEYTEYGNPDGLDRLGGLYIEAGELLFTGYKYFDGSTSVNDVFGVLKDTDNLATSPILGFFKTGYRAHTAGWVSPVPAELQSVLKGTHIIGCGKSQSIAGRYPLRPTAFTFNGLDVFGNDAMQETLNVTPLIDGDLSNKLPTAMWNIRLDEAYYAIIPPGSRTYIAFGGRGGMFSEIGYKITTDAGRTTNGYAAQDDDDHYMYYWMYNIDDMIRAADGEISPVEVYPYEHGRLPLPFMSPRRVGSIGGGTWDPETETVYLLLTSRDRVSQYTTIPMVVGLRFEKFDGNDTTAPYGVMTKPWSHTEISGTVLVEAHAVDNVDEPGDLTVQFTVNGENVGEPATTFPFRTQWDTTGLEAGKYSISGVMRDKAGNTRQLNSVETDILEDVTGPAPATVYTWTGGGDGSTWSDAVNWDVGGGQFPDSKDDVAVFMDDATVNYDAAASGVLGALWNPTTDNKSVTIILQRDLLLDHTGEKGDNPSPGSWFTRGKDEGIRPNIRLDTEITLTLNALYHNGGGWNRFAFFDSMGRRLGAVVFQPDGDGKCYYGASGTTRFELIRGGAYVDYVDFTQPEEIVVSSYTGDGNLGIGPQAHILDIRNLPDVPELRIGRTNGLHQVWSSTGTVAGSTIDLSAGGGDGRYGPKLMVSASGTDEAPNRIEFKAGGISGLSFAANPSRAEGGSWIEASGSGMARLVLEGDFTTADNSATATLWDMRQIQTQMAGKRASATSQDILWCGVDKNDGGAGDLMDFNGFTDNYAMRKLILGADAGADDNYVTLTSTPDGGALYTWGLEFKPGAYLTIQNEDDYIYYLSDGAEVDGITGTALELPSGVSLADVCNRPENVIMLGAMQPPSGTLIILR